jgi:hypothetical protein
VNNVDDIVWFYEYRYSNICVFRIFVFFESGFFSREFDQAHLKEDMSNSQVHTIIACRCWGATVVGVKLKAYSTEPFVKPVVMLCGLSFPSYPSDPTVTPATLY